MSAAANTTTPVQKTEDHPTNVGHGMEVKASEVPQGVKLFLFTKQQLLPADIGALFEAESLIEQAKNGGFRILIDPAKRMPKLKGNDFSLQLTAAVPFHEEGGKTAFVAPAEAKSLRLGKEILLFKPEVLRVTNNGQLKVEKLTFSLKKGWVKVQAETLYEGKAGDFPDSDPALKPAWELVRTMVMGFKSKPSKPSHPKKKVGPSPGQGSRWSEENELSLVPNNTDQKAEGEKKPHRFIPPEELRPAPPKSGYRSALKVVPSSPAEQAPGPRVASPSNGVINDPGYEAAKEAALEKVQADVLLQQMLGRAKKKGASGHNHHLPQEGDHPTKDGGKGKKGPGGPSRAEQEQIRKRLKAERRQERLARKKPAAPEPKNKKGKGEGKKGKGKK